MLYDTQQQQHTFSLNETPIKLNIPDVVDLIIQGNVFYLLCVCVTNTASWWDVDDIFFQYKHLFIFLSFSWLI